MKGWNFAEDLGEIDTDYGSGYPNGNNVRHVKVLLYIFSHILSVLHGFRDLSLKEGQSGKMMSKLSVFCC